MVDTEGERGLGCGTCRQLLVSIEIPIVGIETPGRAGSGGADDLTRVHCSVPTGRFENEAAFLLSREEGKGKREE
jgi:hypothetical protein